MGNLNNDVIHHPMQEESESVKNMVGWVKIVLMFKKSIGKSGQQDIRNLLLMI